MTFSGHAPGSREYRRLIVGLFFAGIATFAQLYSAQAVLPQISSDLSVSPATAALSVSAATLGLALAVIPWSVVADRIGRVPAMATGVLTATVLGLSAPLSGEIITLLSLRFAEEWHWAPCRLWPWPTSARRSRHATPPQPQGATSPEPQ